MDIARLLNQGESDTVEFKSTLRPSDDKPDEARENVNSEIAQTLAAFLNSRKGGTLIVGVSDNGKPTGRLLEAFNNPDEAKKKDAALQYLIYTMSHKLGKVQLTHMSFNFQKIEEEWILVIRCPFNEHFFPTYVSQAQPPHRRDFYVRLGNTTQQLTGEDIQRYIDSVRGTISTINIDALKEILEEVKPPSRPTRLQDSKKVQYGDKEEVASAVQLTDLDCYLKDLFSLWIAGGDIDPDMLSAFDSILRIAGYEEPRQTMQSWVEFAKERVSNALGEPTSELDFLDIDLSIELDQLDVEASFFFLYKLSHKQREPSIIARVRLALIALVGEEKQKQLVKEFNEKLLS